MLNFAWFLSLKDEEISSLYKFNIFKFIKWILFTKIDKRTFSKKSEIPSQAFGITHTNINVFNFGTL